MNLYVHKLTYPRFAHIINSNRFDPVTKEPLCEGQDVVACAKCKSIFILYSWNFLKQTHCDQTDTLIDILDLEEQLNFFLGTESFETFSSLIEYVNDSYDYWMLLSDVLKYDSTLDLYKNIFTVNDKKALDIAKHDNIGLYIYSLCCELGTKIKTFSLFGKVINLSVIDSFFNKKIKDKTRKKIASLVLNGDIQEYYKIFLNKTKQKDNLSHIFNQIENYWKNHSKQINSNQKIVRYLHFIDNASKYILPLDYDELLKDSSFSLIDNIYSFYTKSEMKKLSKKVGFDIGRKLKNLSFEEYKDIKNLYYLEEKYIPNDFMDTLKENFSKNSSLLGNFPRKRTLSNYLKRGSIKNEELTVDIDTLENANMQDFNTSIGRIRLHVNNKHKETIQEQERLNSIKAKPNRVKKVLPTTRSNTSTLPKANNLKNKKYPPKKTRPNYKKIISILLVGFVFLIFLEKIMPETLRETLYNSIQLIIRLFNV